MFMKQEILKALETERCFTATNDQYSRGELAAIAKTLERVIHRRSDITDQQEAGGSWRLDGTPRISGLVVTGTDHVLLVVAGK